jgi:hypothetical protein
MLSESKVIAKIVRHRRFGDTSRLIEDGYDLCHESLLGFCS